MLFICFTRFVIYHPPTGGPFHQQVWPKGLAALDERSLSIDVEGILHPGGKLRVCNHPLQRSLHGLTLVWCQQTLLNAYVEVANQLANISNLKNSYELKAREVEALTQSITISNNLFRSARADYMEVLLTQRDALESRFDLIETKKQQMNAMVSIYQALGGGWR